MRRLLSLFRRFGGWVHRLTDRVTSGVQHLVTVTVSRLTERWHTDSIYRRTLIAAASALSATVLPHPAAAAAVGALLADHTSRTSSGRRGYHADEYDEFDEYPRHHTPAHPPWPGQLWQAFD